MQETEERARAGGGRRGVRPQAERVWLPRLVIYNFHYHTRFIIAYIINTKYYDNVSIVIVAMT